MRPIFIIALFTIQELIAHRFFSFISLIGLGCYALIYGMLPFIVSGHIKIVLDGSLFAFQLCTYLFVLFLIVPLFARIENSNMINFFIAAGINRSCVLFGIVAGLTIMLFSAMMLYYAIALFILYYETNQWLYSIWPAFITTMLEAVLFTQLALLWSLLVSASLTYICLFSIYIICYLNHTWLELVLNKAHGLKYLIGITSYYLLPDLQLLDIKHAVIYGIPFATEQFLGMSIYTLLFSCMILSCIQLIFKRKQLK